ncbi:hypothetical protein, partial [Salmonella sp. s51933]|uniref:hypothetical protein n=1 Tax=Salmonella sp. s51933 TaxID=3160127 RepID=UPI00375425B0
MKLIDDIYYEVEGKTVMESGGNISESLIGGNKSAEETCTEEYAVDAVYGCNIVLTHRLEKVVIATSKKDYTTILKPYVKAVHGKLCAERAQIFKDGVMPAVKNLKQIWDDLIPYRGESSTG